MNRQLTSLGHQIANHSLVRCADRESQDKNLVGSLDRFAKTAGSSILTHVHPYLATERQMI